MLSEDDALVRRIADCLEEHLCGYGFDPYRYPSGENKSVTLVNGTLYLHDSEGRSWVLQVERRP